MLRLLNIEYKKIKNYAVFWIIFTTVIALFLFTSILIFKSGSEILADITKLDFNFLKEYFRFPNVWISFTWIAGWFSHFWALLIIILMGNEFNFRMFRQQLVTGVTRKDLFKAKLLLIAILPVVMLLLIVILSLTAGFVYNVNTVDIWYKNSYFIFNFYLQTIAYLSFAMMIVLLIRSTGLSIVVYFAALISESILRLFLRISLPGVVSYMPLKSISALTPRPSIEIGMQSMTQGTGFSDNPMAFSEPITLLIPFAYTVLFVWIIYRLITKRDL